MHSIHSDKVSFWPFSLILFLISILFVFIEGNNILMGVAGYGSQVNTFMGTNFTILTSSLLLLLLGMLIGKKSKHFIHTQAVLD